MGCTIDHLRADHRVHVIRSFTDARGRRHVVGETAIIRAIDLDWNRQEISIAWDRDGERDTLHFELMAKDGPRNGHMREYFELGERVPLPRERRRVPVPELKEKAITDPAQYSDAIARVWALAARRRFDEAEVQIQLIVAAPDPHGARLEQLADDMIAMAILHAEDADAAVFEWARQRGISLWYAWGSGATSGGEGAVRREKIDAVEERLAACARGRCPPP